MKKLNKTLLLSGTSRGVGNQTALTFIDRGIHVIGISRRSPKNLIGNSHYTHLSIDLEQLDREQLRQALLQINRPIDYVIHNAGFLVNKPFVELTSQDILRAYQINTLSIFAINQVLLSEQKLLSKSAHFVNIGSIGGIQGSVKFGGLSAYSTSKMAAQGLQELLAEEYKDSGYSFNTIALGSVQTEMLNEAFPGLEAQTQTEDIASFLYTFCTEQAHLFNGKTIPLANSTP